MALADLPLQPAGSSGAQLQVRIRLIACKNCSPQLLTPRRRRRRRRCRVTPHTAFDWLQGILALTVSVGKAYRGAGCGARGPGAPTGAAALHARTSTPLRAPQPPPQLDWSATPRGYALPQECTAHAPVWYPLIFDLLRPWYARGGINLTDIDACGVPRAQADLGSE